MRKWLIVLLLPFFFTRTMHAQGIAFNHDTWTEVLARAKAENRLIFMDAYTTWCGPCKMMTAKTFPDSMVGTFFNTNFINVKMDMEQGDGVALATRYRVTVYPTLLFVNGSGQVVHRVVGYHTAEDLLRVGRRASDPDGSLAALERRYQQGDRGAKLLYALMQARAAAYDAGAAPLANDYLRAQTDLAEPQNMDVIMHYVEDPFSDGFRFLINNRPLFDTKYTAGVVAEKVDGVFENYLQTHPDLQLGEVQRLYGTVYPEKGEQLASNYRMIYYTQRSDMEHFGQAAADHYSRFPSDDADELNEIAYLFYQNVKDKGLRKIALQWAEKSVKIQETYYNQETLARLLATNGKKKAAKKAARRSIELANLAGEDATQTEAFLGELNRK